jgi:formate dehydrogenase major subunit
VVKPTPEIAERARKRAASRDMPVIVSATVATHTHGISPHQDGYTGAARNARARMPGNGKLSDHLPPLLRQLRDPLGLGRAAQSKRSVRLEPRTARADKVVQSICPYCAVGCGQKVYAKDGRVIQIEGDPDSPISRGRLCPKGAASEQYVNSPLREMRVKYRRPYSTTWEHLDLDTATDMIADRVIAARSDTWEEVDDKDRLLNRTRGLAFLGGATLDTEENYLIKKLFTALGAVQIENQARI